MSDRNFKTIRKQLRNVVQEIMPEVLQAELVASTRKTVMLHVDNRVDSITEMVKKTLDQLDQRSKDMQSYIVRNVAVPQAPATVEVAPQATDPAIQTVENKS